MNVSSHFLTFFRLISLPSSPAAIIRREVACPGRFPRAASGKSCTGASQVQESSTCNVVGDVFIHRSESAFFTLTFGTPDFHRKSCHTRPRQALRGAHPRLPWVPCLSPPRPSLCLLALSFFFFYTSWKRKHFFFLIRFFLHQLVLCAMRNCKCDCPLQECRMARGAGDFGRCRPVLVFI